MHEVRMPKLGARMESGKVHWLKVEGDHVAAGDALAEAECGKATTRIEAGASGLLLRRVVHEGEAAPVDAVLALIGAWDPEAGDSGPRAIDAALSRSGMLSEMEGDFIREQRDSALEPGRILSARFEIVRLIGVGGMGAVYEATDRILAGRAVALKVLLPSLTSSPEAHERFTREVMVTRELRHPGIVSVYDVGVEGDLLYLTMEYVDGENAGEWRRRQGGRIDAKNACGFMCKVGEALRHAHENGVIHGDLKPQNVLVATGGRIRVVNFGLDRAVGAGAYARTRAALGTPCYMAPEQSRNEPGVDARADVYSCGVILYELLTGEAPIGRFPLPSEAVESVPKELDDLVDACLQSVPSRRLASAKDMLSRLRAVYRTADDRPSAVALRSPLAGKFYEAPAPGAAPFVRVGDRATEDTVVYIIEAMKVMNEVKAEADGVVAQVLARNGDSVAEGQAVMVIERPDSAKA